MIKFSLLPLFGVFLVSAVSARSFSDAYAAHVNGDHAEAIELYDAVLADGELPLEERLRIYRNRARALSVAGDHDAAILDFSRALELKPDSAAIYYSRGVNRFFLGRFSEAVSDLGAALNLEPDNPYAVIWLHLASRYAGVRNADTELAARAEKLDLQDWPGPVVAWYLDRMSLKDLIVQVRDRDFHTQVAKTCETGFYVGQQLLLKSRRADARRWLATAVATCHDSFVELTGARAELARLETDPVKKDSPPVDVSSVADTAIAPGTDVPANQVDGAPREDAAPRVAIEERSQPDISRSQTAQVHVTGFVKPAPISEFGEAAIVPSPLASASRPTIAEEVKAAAASIMRPPPAQPDTGARQRPSSARAGVSESAPAASPVSKEVAREPEVAATAAPPISNQPEPATWGGSVMTSTAEVNVRSGPGVQYRRVASLQIGQNVQVEEKIDEWFRVRLDNGVTGHVHGDFLQARQGHHEHDAPVATAAGGVSPQTASRVDGRVLETRVVDTAVNLRAGPGTEHPPLGVLADGTRVGVMGEVGGWIRVRVLDGTRQGFVYGSFLVPEPVQTPSLAAAGFGAVPSDDGAGSRAAGSERLITTTRVNMRVGPGTQYRRLGIIEEGTELLLEEQVGEWLRVRVGARRSGFVHQEFAAPIITTSAAG